MSDHVVPVRSTAYVILVLPQFPMLALSCLIEPLRAANLLAGGGLYDWAIVSLDGLPVSASNGMMVEPSQKYEAVTRADRIIVCAGSAPARAVPTGMLQWLRDQARYGAHVGSVAGGAYYLAQAGLLDGYRATMHWANQPVFAASFPAVTLERGLYCIDRNRFSAFGGVACMDLQLAFIGDDYGSSLADNVADWFAHAPLRGLDGRRPMPLGLRSSIRDDLVLACVTEMENNLETPLSVSVLANNRGVSVDALERAFRKEVDLTPAAYYRRVRLDHAALLLEHGRHGIAEVATACGYSDPTAFARAFRVQFDLSPTEFRKKKQGI